MYGKDYNYAESRLSDSIVRIAKTNEPVLVESVDMDTGSVRCHVLRDGTLTFVELDDLNFKPVPLGWCNMRLGATYLARIPKRRDWRQGIRAETCFSSRVEYRRIPHEDLSKCIRGEYPAFKELNAKPWGGRLIAWSRKWASNGLRVYYGNLGAVGELRNGEVVLDEEYSFLKESLQKSMS